MKRRVIMTVLPVVVVSLALAFPATAGASLWPMIGGSRAHPSASNFRGPQTSELAWSFAAKGPIRGGAAVDIDGSIFFGTAKGTLFALEQSGAERWRVEKLRRLVGVPVLDGKGRVYAASATGVLHAFDARTGAPMWTFQAESPITASPVLGAGGSLYFATRRSGLVAVAPDGTQLWQAAIGKIVGSAVAIDAAGTLFVGTVDGRLVALDPAGNVVWETEIPRTSLLGTPVVQPTGRLYVGAKKGGLAALDAATGALLWRLPVPKAMGGLAIGPNGRIVFGAKDGKVYSVRDDGSAGSIHWTLTLDTKILSTPAIDRDGAIFIGADDHRVFAIEPAIGTIRWTFDARKPVRSAIALGIGGRVLVGADDRSLHAIGEPKSGEECWSDAFVDAEGLTPEEADRRFQILLAACGGPGADSCSAVVQGAANADRMVAANRIIASEIDPPTYLAILRDRTRKLIALKRAAGLCDVAAGDEDGDLVADADDVCPGTPPLTPTTDDGCTDATLPAAPPADLVRRYLDAFHIAFDSNCTVTIPFVPVLRAYATANSVRPHHDFIHLGIDTPNNQASGCGTWYEFEAFVTKPDGTVQSFYLVLPRSKGTVSSTDPSLVFFRFGYTDASPFGDFVRSGALYGSNKTRIRVRATNFRGVRSVWSSF